MRYDHTQKAYWIIILLVALAVFYAFILSLAPIEPLLIILLLLILAILSSFTSLNVAIDDSRLRVRFGWGIFHKKFNLREIKSVKVVRNKWYYGFGIRIWFWPRMVIFNIQGLDAVEIIMRNDRRYRVGTDEPKKLEKAIKAALR